jgi:hypothetical protein
VGAEDGVSVGDGVGDTVAAVAGVGDKAGVSVSVGDASADADASGGSPAGCSQINQTAAKTNTTTSASAAAFTHLAESMRLIVDPEDFCSLKFCIASPDENDRLL